MTPSPPAPAGPRAGAPPRAAGTKRTADASDRVPVDARLVPAALASWAVCVVALTLGWGPGAVVTAAAAGAAVTATARLRRAGNTPRPRHTRRCCGGRRIPPPRPCPPPRHSPPPRRLAAAVLAAAACAGAVGLGATARVHAVAAHPLRADVQSGASATLRVVLTGDPAPVRAAVPGPPRVVVPAELLGTRRPRDGAAGTTSSGRVVLLAPAEGWSRLAPGQEATASGTLAASTRADLTVAVLRTRGPPTAVGPVPAGERVAGELRRGLREASRAVLDEDAAGLLPGLVVGDTSGLSASLEDDFRTAGLTHLTAVSGTNVAIVVGAVLLLARLLTCGPRTAAAVAVLALVGFVVLARPSPSVLRAATMGGLVVLALALGRRRSVLPALATAVIVLLLVDPALAVDAGFALSVLATAALVTAAPALAQRLRARGAPPGIAEALAVPLVAHLATAPVIAGLSGRVSLVAVAANLLAAPMVAPATVLGVLAALLAPWWTSGAHVLVRVAGPEVSWLVSVARRAAAVDGASFSWPDGVGGGLLLAAVLAAVVVALRWRRLRLVVLAVAVGVAVVLVPVRLIPVGWPPAGWAMVTCDVGQGDGLVLATGEPGRVVLVDAGPDDAAVDGCLSRLGVRSIAIVVVSHLHADHVGGLAGALRGRGVGAVAVGPVHEPDATFAQVQQRAAAAGAPVVGLERGVAVRWPALALEILGPVRPPGHLDEADGTEVNNTSVVLRATTPAGRILLPGDAEREAQSTLLAAGTDLHADVLKVPHHGSRSSLPEFLVASAARLAVVSVGQGNTYGHPHPGTLGVLARSGMTVRRTDEVGDVALVAGPDGSGVVARGAPRPPPAGRSSSNGRR